MDVVIYMRLPKELDEQLEQISQQMPGGKKSTVARFLLEKAVEEYWRRVREGRQDWFAVDAVMDAA